MPDIYDHHKAAFPQVEAHVILKDGERVATVAFKYPRDGAGRLWVYVHWFGLEMVRGHAGGYGYDKRSAAVAAAARKMMAASGVPSASQTEITDYREFLAAGIRDDGNYWDRRLRDAGFEVLQAV